MRYRIQIQGMLDCTLCTVTEIVEHRGHVSHSTKMYTIQQFPEEPADIIEILGELQRLLGESAL
jgi:hypothetical protein